MVLSDGVDVFHDGLYNTGWKDNAPPIVEQNVVISVALVGPSNLAVRV